MSRISVLEKPINMRLANACGICQQLSVMNIWVQSTQIYSRGVEIIYRSHTWYIYIATLIHRLVRVFGNATVFVSIVTNFVHEISCNKLLNLGFWIEAKSHLISIKSGITINFEQHNNDKIKSLYMQTSYFHISSPCCLWYWLYLDECFAKCFNHYHLQRHLVITFNIAWYCTEHCDDKVRRSD